MIEKRPRQFLAVWSDDGKSVKGSTFEESFYVDGAFWKNETTNVAPDGFANFGNLFSVELQAQHDALVADKANLEKDLATKTNEYNSTKSIYDSLVASNAQLIEDHATAIDAANATIATQTATISAMELRIAALMTELPFNPRIIDATHFYNRITKDEFASLSVSDDETLRTIAKTILAYKTNDWPVVFESPEFQGLIGYLTGTSFLTAERAAELTKDASRSEAYDAKK